MIGLSPKPSPDLAIAADASLVQLRRQAVLLCIGTTLLVALCELAIGLVFHLTSVMAEGLHTAADLADSLVAFVLVAAASRPADRDHPFGHGKFDSLAALIEGSCVAVTATWAMIVATLILLGVREPHPRPEPITLLAMALASVLYLVVSTRVIRLARKTQSPAVFAEAMHLRTHVWITAGLLGALALSRMGLRQGWSHADRIDALAALVLGTYLMTVAYRIVRPGFRQLMDSALSDHEVEQIVTGLNSFQTEFVEVHAIRTRRAGVDRHADIHLVVDAHTTVEAAHGLSHRIEERIKSILPGLHLLVHVEPAVGAVLEAYRARGVGAVVVPQADPLAHEATHHANHGAHRP